MKIHLLSDIHLESGPYELHPNMDCDVIVAAGDIGVGTQGVEWLKTLDKPVIYVAGNHEYWSNSKNHVDMFQVQRDIRKAAEGSNVHYLENEKVDIDGVEFIGATLWTNLGSCGYDLAPGFIREARFMGDRCISCKEFYQDEELHYQFFDLLERYLNYLRETSDSKVRLREEAIKCANDGKWHPLVSLVLHNRSIRFITSCTKYDVNNPNQKRVVVTHHHPSYSSIIKSEFINRDMLSPRNRIDFISCREPGHYLKAAVYASDLEILQPDKYCLHGLDQFSNQISHWLCGHLHTHLDYNQAGVRISCNPRGRYLGPIDEETRIALALFDYRISNERIAERNKEFEANPFEGDAFDFDRHFVIDVDESIAPVFDLEITKVLPQLNDILARIKSIAVHLETTNLELFMIVIEKLNEVVVEFDDVIGKFSSEISQCKIVLKGAIEFRTDVFGHYFDLYDIGDVDEERASRIRELIVPRTIELRELMISRIEEFKGLNFKELNDKLANEASIKDIIPSRFYSNYDDEELDN